MMKKTINIITAIITVTMYSYAEPLQPKISFEVSGSLDHLIFRNGFLTNQSSPFKMLVSGDQWQIRNFESGDSYSETSCDGINIFHFNKTNTISFDGRYYGIPPTCYWVSAELGPIPSGGYPVEIPWLVYASSAIVQTNPVNLPAPWLDPRYYPMAHAYEARVNVSTNPPYVPESMAFVLSQTQADKACVSPWLNFEDFKIDQHWNPSEPYGFVGASYKVFAVTNIHGLTLPISFELITFRQASKRPISGIYRGTNIIIKEVTIKKIEPTIPDKPLCVRDFRFQNRELNISHIDYVANNWISSAKSDDLQKLFSQKMTDHNLPLTYLLNEKKPVLFYVLFAITLLFPLPILIYMGKNKR